MKTACPKCKALTQSRTWRPPSAKNFVEVYECGSVYLWGLFSVTKERELLPCVQIEQEDDPCTT